MANLGSSDNLPTSLKILIIEDNDTDYLLLARRLKKALADVYCLRAENRAQMLAALTQPMDLIISDYHLLDIEGDELMQTIATAHSNTPCILLSGSAHELETITVPKNFIAKLGKGDFSEFLHVVENLFGRA